jgi:ATP-dependent helicase/nuclease subunit B
MSGHALQLLLEGLIASKGNFENIASAPLNTLTYWHLGSELTPQNLLRIDIKEDDVLAKCEDYLLKLISAFDFETTPYHSHPSPKYVSKNKDYEHLARVKEWSVQDSEGYDD